MTTAREETMVNRAEDELSIVARKDPRELAAALSKIGAFQDLIKTQLLEGRDYGAIPGAGDRKVLLKPGAEKITVLLGLRSRFEIVGKVEDFEAGFFAYMVRCSLVAANGETITEGLGQANTKERKYARQDPYTLANTVLKMARKRALVDAALTVGSLSDIFTQDLEDADLAAEVRKSQQTGAHLYASTVPLQGERMATENQRKAIFAISRKMGVDEEFIRDCIKERYDIESTADLTMAQASELIDFLDENLKQAVNAK
ncbi:MULTISPECIES: hypothetical protein [Acetomicrobium]|uniref:hypothetical protein n=1 Tax=Acetomicrobium TaxID=49894 RepID=UPI0026F19A6A|nr:hypothetical protein [Acetomicrobium mobile]